LVWDNVTLTPDDEDLSAVRGVKVKDCEAWSGVEGEGVDVIMSGDAEVLEDIKDGKEPGVEAPVCQ
jgi:hypothetical protein